MPPRKVKTVEIVQPVKAVEHIDSDSDSDNSLPQTKSFNTVVKYNVNE